MTREDWQSVEEYERQADDDGLLMTMAAAIIIAGWFAACGVVRGIKRWLS